MSHDIKVRITELDRQKADMARLFDSFTELKNYVEAITSRAYYRGHMQGAIDVVTELRNLVKRGRDPIPFIEDWGPTKQLDEDEPIVVKNGPPAPCLVPEGIPVLPC